MSVTISDIFEYEKAVSDLASAKKLELDLRNKIIKSYKFSQHEGVQHRNISDEAVEADISITLKMSRTLDQDALEEVWGELTDEEQNSIEYKPKLVMKNYKKLVADGIGKLSRAVIEKPSQATIKVKTTEIL